ncbi:MAG: S-adenosylmethionine:tRNA ribosyltransferase-isomerase [Chitinophagaceae bacterium]|nr:MAG: S-adenosylmethionine:tRNA ribosyltransferase-isomerase [Chitinophagaceae bacterium]
MHPSQLSISDYTYDLPASRIAGYPLPERDASRLLVWENGQLSETVYRSLPDYLDAGSLVVFNNSRVIEARLLFYKESGARIEIFCLEPHNQYPDLQVAMQQKGSVLWCCMVGGASKWKRGSILEKRLEVNGRVLILQALFSDRRSSDTVIELTWNDEEMSFAELLHHAGDMPLPPYIKRKAETLDQQRYQTIYADQSGSVAAPTAGLHFTDAVFEKLQERNISTAYLTLHVGAGTFKPVSSDQMSGHDMHSELIDVKRDTILQLIEHFPKGITAVGTTSLRTLESLYWFGLQVIAERIGDGLPVLDQWEPYEVDARTSATESLSALVKWMDENGKTSFVAKTRILVAPGYRLRVIRALVTNFHQPKSTLLLLIAAIMGDDWKRMYQYAMDNGFRFLVCAR